MREPSTGQLWAEIAGRLTGLVISLTISVAIMFACVLGVIWLAKAVF